MRLPKPKVARCAVCGRTGPIEMNHVGGKNHLGWFRMPFCLKCHARFHSMQRQMEINLEFTQDIVERVRRAQAALMIAQYMVNEQLKKSPTHEGIT